MQGEPGMSEKSPCAASLKQGLALMAPVPREAVVQRFSTCAAAPTEAFGRPFEVASRRAVLPQAMVSMTVQLALFLTQSG